MSNTVIINGFDDREQYISYFFNMASRIKDEPRLILRKLPLFIILNGESNSGKEVIPLAFDKAFHSDRYPDGKIDRTMKADDMLNPSFADKVCFHGSGIAFPESSEKFDDTLRSFAQASPQARIHFVSNLKRRDLDAPIIEDTFDSNLLDMAIVIKRSEDMTVLREQGLDVFLTQERQGSFRRTATLITKPRTALTAVVKRVKP